MRSYWSRVDPLIQYDGCPYKKGRFGPFAHTGRTPREHEGGGQGDAPASPGMSRTARKLAEARGEPWNGFFLVPEGTSPTNALTLDS